MTTKVAQYLAPLQLGPLSYNLQSVPKYRSCDFPYEDNLRKWPFHANNVVSFATWWSHITVKAHFHVPASRQDPFP